MHLPLRSLPRYLFATCSIMTLVANPAWISSSAAAAVTGEFAFTGSITASMAVQAGACPDGLGLIPASTTPPALATTAASVPTISLQETAQASQPTKVLSTSATARSFGSPVVGGAGLGQGQARVGAQPAAVTATKSRIFPSESWTAHDEVVGGCRR